MSPKHSETDRTSSGAESASETAHVGRRGGTTTMTASRVRKTFWIGQDAEDALRRDAEATGISEAEVFRRVLRRHYGRQDP